MKINNVDGRYQTRDGSIKVIVTRSAIEIEVKKTQDFVIVDDTPGAKPSSSGGFDKAIDIVNKTNKLLMG